MGREAYMNINKTKYRYFMDCLDLTEKRPIIKYTIPVPKGEEKPTDEFFDRDYPFVDVNNCDFVKMIDKTANSLVSIGVKKGDTVIICHSNTPETLYMDLALSKIGAIADYVYPNITMEEMQFYIKEVKCKYVFFLDEEGIRKNVLDAIKDSTVQTIVSSTVIESFPRLFKTIAHMKMKKVVNSKCDKEIKWLDFIKLGEKSDAIENGFIKNEISCLMHTSGTSSLPKAVMISNENINSIARNYEIDKPGYEMGKTCVQTIPQFVSYGITTNHMLFSKNVCVVFIPEMEPKNFYDLIRIYNPEYSFTTPSHGRQLIKRKTDMSKMEILMFGGDGFDSLENDMNVYMHENGSRYPAYQGYGSTEMSAVTMYNTLLKHKVGSLGALSGEVKALIVEPDTFNEITEPNKVGELCLSGPGMTLGYAGNSKDETDKVFVKHPDGTTWVHMGDYISVDEDGFFYYHGRIKNVIARKSFKFSPKEIDDAILSLEEVLQCVTVAKYDAEEGQVPSTHIVLRENEDSEKTMDKILSVVNEKIQEFHRPVVYKIHNDIIRTRNNKVNINALRIEDNATIHPDVNDAEILLLNDKDYDYKLKLFTNTETNEQSVIDFIEQITKNEKILNGKILYEFLTGKSSNYIRYV